jgi:pimeloyl-ACP methyl ester carboxylesterase
MSRHRMPSRPSLDELDLHLVVPVEHRHLLRSWGHQHVVVAGPVDAPAVVLVHGWPQHWFAWRHVVGALAGERRVVAVDLRGMGWSDADPTADRSIEVLADDLVQVLDDLDVERADLVGHDWGGWLAFEAALGHPQRVAQVVGVSITPPWLRWQGLVRHAPTLSYTLAMAAVGRRVVRHPSLVAEMLRRSARDQPWWTPDGRVAMRSYQERIARPDAAATTAGLYGELVRRAARDACGPRTRTLTMPGTIVLGEQEPITTPDLFWPCTGDGEVEVLTVPDAGHWLPEEQPDALADALSSVLRVVLPAPG